VNIFTRIGFVVLVGLASKNAILIVEFAKQQRVAGKSGREATLEACRLRLRPIVMTSLAFILGVLPLIISRGAGAEMRNTLGTAVFSGMLGVTLFGLLLTPVFFYSIDWLGGSHVFASAFMQRVNHVSLAVVTLKPFRWTARMAWHRLVAARQSSRTPKPAIRGRTDGQHVGLEELIDSKSPSGTPPINGRAPINLKTPSMKKRLEAADVPASGMPNDE